MNQDQQGRDAAGGEQPVVPGAAPGQPTPHGPPVPPPYGQPVPVQPLSGQPVSDAARPTDGIAIAALVTGILGLGVVPLEVAGFTTAGLATDDAIVAAGAREAYTATYTDGTSTVGVALSHWASAEQAQAWAASQDARFTAAQVVDTGELNDGDVKYRYYEVDGVVTVVATDATVAMTMTGPSAVVDALYKAFPI
jgi:hypothetical protein